MAAPTWQTADPLLQTRIVDDKSPICIPFILSRVEAYRKQQSGKPNPRPFIIGLNGVQGVGKTTLVRALAETLQEREGLPTLVVSIDDFYLTHADQLALAAAHPDNALVQHRGEPAPHVLPTGTHDIPLLTNFLDSLVADPSTPIPVPRYDKSAFSGAGDRLPPSAWPLSPPNLSILLLEGWCVGFRPLPARAVEARWSSRTSRTLHNHKLDHLLFVNEQLAAYDAAVNARLDAFVHIDAADMAFVYDWRLQQEAQLRAESGGRGMTDEQVVRFVDAYYPAYELYTDAVREGVFWGKGEHKAGCQLRLVVGKDRRVVDHMVI